MLVSIKGPPQVWLQHQVGLQESVCRPLHASLLGIVQGCLSFTRAFVGMIRGGLCIICLSRLPPGALKDWTLLSRVQNVGLFSLAVAFDSRTARITGVRVWRQKNLSLICPCRSLQSFTDSATNRRSKSFYECLRTWSCNLENTISDRFCVLFKDYPELFFVEINFVVFF